MKFKIILAAFLLAFSVGVSANDNNAPLYNLWLEDMCTFYGPDFAVELDVHVLWLENGRWSFNCNNAELIEGELPDRVFVKHSSDRNPIGFCCVPWGCSYNMHAVLTPSGEGVFTCHGEIE